MDYLYEFSVSAQLTGSIFLLLWSFSKMSKNILDMCFPGIVSLDSDSEGNFLIKKEKIQNNARIIARNIWAFSCLVLGYVASIFSNDIKTHNVCCSFVIVFFMTICLIIVGEISSNYYAKSYKEDYKLTSEEVEKYDVLTAISSDDIHDMFK